jgi:carbon-monoxide dehydrogenase medium subunit
VPELDRIETANGWLDIGARTRHVDLERTTTPGPLGRLLRLVAPHIGHFPIRMRGTIGGSLAHADPAAEWCALVLALDAEMTLLSDHGARLVGAADFFEGYFTTALRPDELLTSIRLPILTPETVVGFQELARRAGDFALVAAITVLEVERGRISRARIGLGGVSDRPLRAAGAEQVLVGQVPEPDVFVAAAETAVLDVDPSGDAPGSSEYRRGLIRALVRRALQQARLATGER